METRSCLAALCVMSCATTQMFADENGFVPSVAVDKAYELVNPQPGMIFSAYPFERWMMLSDSEEGQLRINVGLGDGDKDTGQKQKTQLWESLSSLPRKAALKTGIDKSDKISTSCASGVNAAIVRWEGYVKCKLTRTYTFTIQKNYYNGALNTHRWLCGYAVRINGKYGLAGYGMTTFDAELKAGFNKIEIVSLVSGYRDIQNVPLSISAKIKGGLAEPTKLSPGSYLYYDDVPALHENGFD